MSDDRALVKNLSALVRESGLRQTTDLPAPKPRAARAATTGKGIPKPREGGQAGGIASPLTETDAGTREFWEVAVLTSTDGVFTWHESAIKRVQMVDNNGEPVELQFAAPA